MSECQREEKSNIRSDAVPGGARSNNIEQEDRKNIRQKSLDAALMFAALNGTSDQVKEYLKLGANALAVDAEGKSALYWALSSGRLGCVRALLELSDLSQRSNESKTVLEASILGSKCECVQAVLEHMSAEQKCEQIPKALVMAVRIGFETCAHVLVQHIETESLQKEKAEYILCEAIQCGSESCVKLIMERRIGLMDVEQVERAMEVALKSKERRIYKKLEHLAQSLREQGVLEEHVKIKRGESENERKVRIGRL